MKGKIIHGSNDTIGLVTNAFRVHEVPNNIRQMFSKYNDEYTQARNGKISWAVIRRPKEFNNYSCKVQDLITFLVRPGSTSKRKRNTWIYEVLIGNKKKYYTKKETEEIIEL